MPGAPVSSTPLGIRALSRAYLPASFRQATTWCKRRLAISACLPRASRIWDKKSEKLRAWVHPAVLVVELSAILTLTSGKKMEQNVANAQTPLAGPTRTSRSSSLAESTPATSRKVTGGAAAFEPADFFLRRGSAWPQKQCTPSDATAYASFEDGPSVKSECHGANQCRFPC